MNTEDAIKLSEYAEFKQEDQRLPNQSINRQPTNRLLSKTNVSSLKAEESKNAKQEIVQRQTQSEMKKSDQRTQLQENIERALKSCDYKWNADDFLSTEMIYYNNFNYIGQISGTTNII